MIILLLKEEFVANTIFSVNPNHQYVMILFYYREFILKSGIQTKNMENKNKNANSVEFAFFVTLKYKFLLGAHQILCRQICL